MSIIRKATVNTGSLENFGAAKVNKRLDTFEKALEEKEVDPNKVSFEKPQEDSWFANMPEKAEAAKLEESDSSSEARKQRREEWKEANRTMQRAMQMEKEAKAKLAQVQRFEQVASKAKENPIEIAKALGVDPTEFLRLYQNQMFNITEEKEQPKLDPEEEIKQRLSRYEEERAKEKYEMEMFKSQSIKQNYIASKILPVILADKDKYELLNSNGEAEASAAFIYDLMDNHYRSTGEELNPEDVAEAMEEELVKELESKILSTKQVKKFSKHFREDTAARGQELTLPGQLGDKDVMKRSTDMASLAHQIKESSNENSYQKQNTLMNKREARLNAISNLLKK